jgi:YfiH family protein
VPLVWDDAAAVPLLRWHGPPGIVAAFTTRRGGVSTGPWASLDLGLSTGDDPAAVAENRRRLCAAVGIGEERVAMQRQVHGAIVRTAAPLPGGFAAPTAAPLEGDALVTREAGLALVALSADCVPIALAAVDGSAVGVVHAGWRGLVAGVVEAAVAALDAGPLAAAIGPCAGPDRYEVGDDVGAPLRERFGDGAVRDGRADLPLCARQALVAAGVGEEHIDVADLCTIGGPDRFFSHRRDGEPGGRQGVIAYRSGG